MRKQETIEEVADREAEARYPVLTYRNPNDSLYKGIKKTFIYGVNFGYNLAQQQNKNLYSDEEVNYLLFAFKKHLQIEIDSEKWFNQFKKKQ
jgi:hypothetical protein